MEGRALSRPSSQEPWLPPHLEVMRQMMRDMNRMFGGFPLAADAAMGAWPRIEMFEREGSLIVRAELPGMEREDVHVRAVPDGLVLEGERRGREESRSGYYESEWSYGRFSRRIPLPPGADPERIRATFRNGVLEVDVPIAGSSHREIPIRGGSEETGESGSTRRGRNTEGRAEAAGAAERGGTQS